jgi:riboflavin synthase
MFTGIIETVGRIRRLDRIATKETSSQGAAGAAGDAARVEIAFETPVPERSLAPGFSIAVNGCCLTVVEAGEGFFTADLSPETLRRTSFGQLGPGSLVNLERPLTAGSELGGHFGLGHVDGIGLIERIRREGENGWLSVRIPPELGRYVAMKGSLTIDGISLTIAACSPGLAEFAVIPYTFAHTHLREKSEGDPVNLECDVLARYLERLLEARAEPTGARLTLERLIEEGF